MSGWKKNKPGLLLVFVLALIAVSCSPLHKLGKDPKVLAYEQEIQNLEALPVSDDPKTVLFAGSSSVRLWSDIETNMQPFKVMARGFGGANMGDFAFYSRRLIDPNQCGAIVLFVANDIIGIKYDKDPYDVFHLIKITLKQIRHKHPDTPVFWIEITPTPLRFRFWNKISIVNQLVKEYSEKTDNFHFIPTSQHFLGENGQPNVDYFLDDKLHLNQAGYSIWADCIKNALETYAPELK